MPSPSCDEQGINPLEFIYDHAGVRRRKDASNPTFYPNQYLTDFGGGAGNRYKHVFLGAIRLLTKKARPTDDRQHWYYHADHLGSTSIVTNENGQLAEHTHYFPYGELWLQERPSTPVPYLFSSKEFDAETGFYDFGARYLNPRFGTWMSTDPALGDYLPGAGQAVAPQSPSLANSWRSHPDLPGLGGAFQSPNLAPYGYGHNNPATLTDPNGKQTAVPMGPVPLPVIPHAIPGTPENKALSRSTLAVLRDYTYLFETLTVLSLSHDLFQAMVRPGHTVLMSQTEDLRHRAQGIHGALTGAGTERHEIERRQRTVAVLLTTDGTLIYGGGKRDLDAAQLRTITAAGGVPASLPGEDAEITVLRKADALGKTPLALGIFGGERGQRVICPGCRQVIENEYRGIILPGQQGAVWPQNAPFIPVRPSR